MALQNILGESVDVGRLELLAVDLLKGLCRAFIAVLFMGFPLNLPSTAPITLENRPDISTGGSMPKQIDFIPSVLKTKPICVVILSSIIAAPCIFQKSKNLISIK